MTGPPRARLFVALDLPDGPRRAIARWRDRAIEGRAELRPVREEALHVTLVFLGLRPEAEIEPVAEAVELAVAGGVPARLAPGDLVPVPRRRPRLFALDLADQDRRLGEAQAAVAAALVDAVGFEPEARPFWPHVTLARVRGHGPERPGSPRAPAEPACGPFDADRVTLYRSRPGPGGARYEPLAEVVLR